MGSHGLGILERATGLKIRGDTSGAENMAAELLLEPSLGGASADHPIGVDAVHRLTGQGAGSAARGAEEGAFTVVTDAGSHEIFVDKGFGLVMRRHFMVLAAFLVQPHPPAFAVRIIVMDPHCDNRADA